MFDYGSAFSRNLGWTTEWEQVSLRSRRIAVAGLGGVGGSHLLTLSRLGIGAFSIADFDTFDLVNMNRQAGATMASLGRPKIDVLAEMARAINPELRFRLFPDGVTPQNLDAFLDDADLFVDGLDFFALDIRAKVFARCAERGIPAVTAAPIGMGVGFLAFHPGGMTFEQYFRLAGQPPGEQALRFLLGVAPAGLHGSYLADDTRVDLAAQRGPSTAAACALCAGMVGTQALKILLRRGGVPYAPVHLTMDAYRGRAVRRRLRWGQAGPVQSLKRAIARRLYAAMAVRAPAAEPVPPATPLHAILDAARWAPSGDNTQPWQFAPTGPDSVRIVLRHQAENPYEYRSGRPVLLAGGMLLESLAVAASAHGRRLQWRLVDAAGVDAAGVDAAGVDAAGVDAAEADAAVWEIEAAFPNDAAIEPSVLLPWLPMRSVVRGGMGARPLSAADKAALEAVLDADLELSWHEPFAARRALWRLGARATDIRLRCEEAFGVHRRAVDWQRKRSPAGIPAEAIGLNAPTRRLMRWGMHAWPRMQRLNRLMGTAGASVQLDVWPGLRSAAFFSVRQRAPGGEGGGDAGMLQAGMSLQRFWLTAARLGLGMQPALATLIFADHGCRRVAFTRDAALLRKAEALGQDLERLLGPVDGLVFIGRLGGLAHGMPGARSTRRPVADLLLRRLGAGEAGPVVAPEKPVAGDV